METINLRDKLATFDDTWSPKLIGALNGQACVLINGVAVQYVWCDGRTMLVH